jgi:hypothetical protein
MTLTVFNNLEQGSDEWLAARCGLITASTVGKLLTSTLKVADNDTSRGLTETLVAERITGHVEYVHPSFDMQRGTMDEPYARDLYREQYAPVEEIGFATNVFSGHTLGASPDGLVHELGGIEIKSRTPKVQLRTILSDTVPTENLAQIHASMLVMERDWWDYVSYAGGWPIYVKRVYADPKWQTAIRDALDLFEENAARMIAEYTDRMGDAPVAPRIDHFAEIELKL